MDISDKNLRKLPIDRDMKKKDLKKAAVSAAMSFPKCPGMKISRLKPWERSAKHGNVRRMT